MKILIITCEPFPCGMAATTRIRNLTEGLVHCGVETTVLTIRATESSDSKPMNTQSQGVHNGVKFRYITSCFAPNSLIRRKLNSFRDLFKACKYIIQNHDFDFAIVVLNSILREYIINIACKTRGIKVIKELCEYPYYKDCRKGTFQLNHTFKHYDGFIAISHELEHLAQKCKKTSAQIVRIPIIVNTSNRDTKLPYHHPRPYIFHGGTMYEGKDGIVSTMKAFAIACEKLNHSVDFILAGPKSPHQKELDKIINENRLESNVRFLGMLDNNEIKRYQEGASLCVLNKNDTLQNRCGFSTKLGEIMLSGTPVITTTVGEANYYLKDGVSGYITEPHKPELIADQIVRAFMNEEERLIIAKNAKEIAVREFDYRKNGQLLADFFKHISVH